MPLFHYATLALPIKANKSYRSKGICIKKTFIELSTFGEMEIYFMYF
jgi:hypothetical protein